MHILVGIKRPPVVEEGKRDLEGRSLPVLPVMSSQFLGTTSGVTSYPVIWGVKLVRSKIKLMRSNVKTIRLNGK